MLPAQVATLMTWPTAEQQEGKGVQPSDSSRAIWAKQSSIDWIEDIIDPQWLPESPEKTLASKLILLQKAYDALDTSHVEWEKNGYRFRVSQTRTVFYLSVTALQGDIADADPSARRLAVRKLASTLIRDIPDAKSVDGRSIAVGGTKQVLMHSMFDAAKTIPCDGGLVAEPARLESDDKQDRDHWDWWWRRMGWWTNGETLGLFTLKTKGGAWSARYGSDLDKYWLSPEPLEWKR